MLTINYPENNYVHSSASTSDSEEEGCCKTLDLAKNKKLKNELCRNYLNTGFCRYYDKCQFAHGIDELRQSEKSNLKYKTKECQSYFVRGCCQYGERCNFLHRKKDETLSVSEKWKLMRTNFKEVIDGRAETSRLL